MTLSKHLDNQAKAIISNQEILVIIDSTVEDYQFLADGIILGATVLILEEQEDGIAQITKAIKQIASIESVNIISHGSPGCIYLGNSQLS
jgi:hypothetical protein